MVLRFRQTDGTYKIVSVEYAEVDEVDEVTVTNGKWVFKDEQEICSSLL